MQSFSDFYNVYKSSSSAWSGTYSDFSRTSGTPSSPAVEPKIGTKCVVVIPAYRSVMGEFETANFRNNVARLSGKFDICVVCPKTMNTGTYEREAGGTSVMFLRLPSANFTGKNSYSRMMTSPWFYSKFSKWENILILQLDAYIFGTADELDAFISLGHTYMGAPWTKEYASAIGIPEETCGNGGVSLRNVDKMISLLSSRDVPRNPGLASVEDQYISYMLHARGDSCPVGDALRFSIDNQPKFWHARLGSLPWAIHMGKQEFVDYWNSVTGNMFSPKADRPRKIRLGEASSGRPSEMVIVSMTSFGKRLANDAPVVIREMLTTQTKKPDLIVLSVYRQDVPFIPESVRKYEREGKVEILVSDKNHRPHLKYYPAMKKHKDAVIITVDDDQHYRPDTIASLLEAHAAFPGCVCARRCHLIRYSLDGVTPLPYGQWQHECDRRGVPSFDLFATGVGGVLYPPDILHVDSIREEDMDEYITTDDIFLKILENEAGIMVAQAGKTSRLLPFKTASASENRLCDANTAENGINDANIAKGRLKRPSAEIVKICYTCITGGYDTLKDPKVVTPGWRYVCFTDRKDVRSDIWDVRPLPEEVSGDASLSTVKKQRIVKIQPYRFLEPHSVSLWVDGNIIVNGNLDDFVKESAGSAPMAVCRHPKRDCIYDEAKAIVEYKKDTWKNLDQQVRKYTVDGFPSHFGLNETNVIVRKDCGDVRRISDAWAEELRKFSHRDQMSFNYVLWKLGIKISDFPIGLRGKYFTLKTHRKMR